MANETISGEARHLRFILKLSSDSYRLGSRLECFQKRQMPVRHFLPSASYDVSKEILLLLEIVVDDRLVDSDLVSNCLQGGIRVALLSKFPFCRVENKFSRVAIACRTPKAFRLLFDVSSSGRGR